MALKPMKKITDKTDLESLLEEPGWKSAPSKRLKEIQSAAKRNLSSRRGGARPGAGRKPLPAKARRVTISAMVAPQTAQWLRVMAQNSHRSLGAVLDSLAL